MLSYWGLRKRGLPKTKEYLISEYFEPDARVWVDSGAVQADKSGWSKEELEEYAADYQEFIASNYDRIEGWVEFDSQVLGFDWILDQRDAIKPDNKMWVVWHEKYGANILREWSEEYSHIAIPGEYIESFTSLAGLVRGIKASHPTQFHALATAKPDNLRSVPFDTATTLSWLSPMRRGETIIWDGMRLTRYPKRMKDQARSRYKTIVEKAGFDFKKFKEDEKTESTKVAIWSYLQLEKAMSKSNNHPWKPSDNGIVSDNSDDTLYTGLMEMGGYGSNNSGSEMRKVERTELQQRDPNEVTSLPVFGYEVRQVVDTIDGKDVLAEAVVVKSNSTPLRQCDSCYLAANCPAFKPANTCAFSFPVRIETPEQLRQMNTALLEMQASRVAFMRFAEELNGGYADPNLSQEMDRYFKQLKAIKELDESKEFIQITAQRNAGQGVLSAIFGDKVAALKEQTPVISEEKTTYIISDKLEG